MIKRLPLTTDNIADAIACGITWHYTPSDIPIEGNAIVSGDDEFDRAEEQRIREALESGDDAAWFDVECRAEFSSVTASAYLGACSYNSFTEFEQSEYAEDMRHEAREGLVARLAEIASDLESAIKASE